MRIDILTLFPEMFNGVLAASILKRASEKNLPRIICINCGITRWTRTVKWMTDPMGAEPAW